MPGRRGRASMPGSWGLTAIGPPTKGLEFFSWEESRPWAWQGSDAGQARPGGYARQECGALGVGRARIGRAIKRGWGEPSNEVGASHQTRLGKPVLIGRARTHWASHQRGWASQYYWASPYSLGEPVLGEPSNEVGASHQTRLGEPVLRGRWASQYSLGEPVLIGRVRTPWAWANPYWANHSTTFTVANACPCLALCLLGTVPARHCACSARLVKCPRHCKCLLGTFGAYLQVPARHVYLQVPARHVYLQVPARHCACSARLIKCPLGTVPARHI